MDKWLQSAKGMLKWLNIRLLPLQVMADQLKRTRLITWTLGNVTQVFANILLSIWSVVFTFLPDLCECIREVYKIWDVKDKMFPSWNVRSGRYVTLNSSEGLIDRSYVEISTQKCAGALWLRERYLIITMGFW